MKNKQKGFIAPLIITILAIIAVGLGIYAYHEKNVADVATSANINIPVTTTDIGSVNTNSQVKTVITSNPNVTTSKPTPAATYSDITLNEAENAQYNIADCSGNVRSVKLSNGKATLQGSGDTQYISILNNHEYLIDIDGNGSKDAILTFDATCGNYLNPVTVIASKLNNSIVTRNAIFESPTELGSSSNTYTAGWAIVSANQLHYVWRVFDSSSSNNHFPAYDSDYTYKLSDFGNTQATFNFLNNTPVNSKENN